MKVLKIISSLLLTALFFFWASWFYKVITLFFIALVWRRNIKEKLHYKHAFKIVMLVLAISLFTVMPRYRTNSDDRIQLIYQDEEGNPVNPPLSHYIANVFFPEEELINIGIWAVRLNLIDAPYVGNKIESQFKNDCKEGKLDNFYRPYRKLNMGGDFMLSGVTSQLANMYGMPHTQAVYLIKPEHYDSEKKYPLVFFCHGGMGNWKLYQGLWKSLDDCIVLSVGTDDWDGLYGYDDINKLFTRQLPFLENLGYKIDESQIHLIGISNGGTASNIAYNNFAKRFKSITFVSTGIFQTKDARSKVILIGGGKDGSSTSLLPAYKRLERNGLNTALFWDEEETHFIMVNRQDEALDFLNKEMFDKI